MTVKIEVNKKEVLTSQDLQNDYIDFYKCMMNHLWDMKVVTNLANLEIAIFKRFPDKEEMEKYINLLEPDIRDTLKAEEDVDSGEFRKSFEVLKTDIENFEEIGYDIFAIEQAIDVQKILGEDSSDEDESNKKTIKVSKIIKR